VADLVIHCHKRDLAFALNQAADLAMPRLLIGLDRQEEVGLHTQNQRQGRAVHPHPLQGLGLCHGLPELRGAQPLAAPLPVDL